MGTFLFIIWLIVGVALFLGTDMSLQQTGVTMGAVGIILFVVYLKLRGRKKERETEEEEEIEEGDEGEEESEKDGGGGGRLRRIPVLTLAFIIVFLAVLFLGPRISRLTSKLPVAQKVEQTVVGELGVVVPVADTEKFADDGQKLGIVTTDESQQALAVKGFQVSQVKINGQVHKDLTSLVAAIKTELEAGRELDILVTIEVTCGGLREPECWKGPAWVRPTNEWLNWLQEQEKVTTAGAVGTTGVAEEAETKAEKGESNVFFACFPFLLIFAFYFFVKYRVDRLGQPRILNPPRMNIVFKGGEQPGWIDYSINYELRARGESLWQTIVALWNILIVREARTRASIQTKVNSLLSTAATKREFSTFERKRDEVERAILADKELQRIASAGGLKITDINIERTGLTEEARSAAQQRIAARRGAEALKEFERRSKKPVSMWQWIALQIAEALQTFLGSQNERKVGGEK